MQDIQTQCEKIISHTHQSLLGIRGGRAAPALVEDIPVEAYGTTMPLKQLASVSVPEPKTLAISPWDTQVLHSVVKALETADLGAMPSVHGETVHVTLPSLTAERRAQLLKVIGKVIEEGRIALRRVREEMLETLKTQKAAGDVSEDEFFRLKEELEKAIREGNEKLEALRKAKESELSAG